MKKFIYLSLVTGFGLGYSPFAPGTCGSLPGFILVFLLQGFSWYSQVAIILLAFFFGVWLSNETALWFDEKDPKAVTIDEIVSLPITFFLIPLTPVTLAIGFVLNRILDIIKPAPAYKSQSLKGGWGIMTDDLISSIYSNILMHIIVIYVLKISF